MTDTKSQTFMAYVADLELAVQAYTDPLNPDEIIRLVKLTSEQQAIYARAQLSNDWMLTSLVHQGREQEAVYLARLRKDTIEQFNGLFAIWQDSKSRHVSVSELMQLADRKFAVRPPIELCKLGVALARANDARADECFARASENIQSIRDEWKMRNQDNARELLAEALVEVGRLDEAQQVAETISNPDNRNFILTTLASALAHARRIEEAQKIADTITYEPNRVTALSQIASALGQAGDPNADNAFQQVRVAIDNIKYASGLDSALSSLAKGLAQAKRFDEAKDVVGRIEQDSSKIYGLQTLANALIQAKKFDEAHEIANIIPDTSRKTKILTQLTTALAQAQRFDKAHEVAYSIPSTSDQANALIELTTALAQAQRFDKAHEVAHSIKPVRDQVYALFQIMTALVQAQRFEEAREIADSIQPASEQAYVLIQLANALDDIDDPRANETLQHALAIADTIQNADLKANTLRKITVDRSDDTSRHTHDVMFTPQDMPREADYQKAVALRLLAVSLARAGDPRADDMFEQARDEANSIRVVSGSHQKRYALHKFAVALAEVQRFDEAHELAKNIEDDTARTDALREIATLLIGVDDSRADAIFEQARESAIVSKATDRNGFTLNRLADTLIQTQRFDEAESFINTIGNHWVGNSAERDLAIARAQAQGFDEARKHIDKLDTTSTKSMAYTKLAEALARVDDPRADEVFKLAREVSLGNLHRPAQAVELTELASTLARVQRFDEALEVVDFIIEYDLNKSIALCEVAKALAQVGDSRADDTFDHAKSILDIVKNNDIGKENALHQLALAIAQTKQLKRSAVVRGLCDIDSYIKFLAEWQPALAEMYPDEPKLWQRMMLSALEIVCWVRTDYEPIRDIFRVFGEDN